MAALELSGGTYYTFHAVRGDVDPAILFPPALAYEVLGGVMSGAKPEGGDFEPDLPEPDLMRAALNLARWFATRYFKTEIEGAERLPAVGPVLMVGNHSAGLMPMTM